jgi:sirohydrochlorin cobaltochelatase
MDDWRFAVTVDGFLLCGHGSRDPASVAGFGEIARGLAPLLPGHPFAHGFMELAEPDLAAAVGKLVAAGATRILAVPGFLFAARHVREDLPRELAAAGTRHGVEVILGRELGADERLVQALGDRLHSLVIPAHAGIQGGRDTSLAPDSRAHGNDGEFLGTALILVGAGSSDAGTNAGLETLAGELGRRHGFGRAVAGFASVAQPTVAEAVEAALAQGYRRLLLLPWFLTDGRLLGLARREARGAAGSAELIEAAALGAHPLVLAALAARAGELAQANPALLPSTRPSA